MNTDYIEDNEYFKQQMLFHSLLNYLKDTEYQHLDAVTLQRIMEAGAEIDNLVNGKAPIHYFIQKINDGKPGDDYRSLAYLRIFIENGADIDIQDLNGNTPLMYCSMLNREKSAQYLIKNGANTKLKNKFHKTYLDISQSKTNEY